MSKVESICHWRLAQTPYNQYSIFVVKQLTKSRRHYVALKGLFRPGALWCLDDMAKHDKRERLRTLRNISADNFNRPLSRCRLIDLHGFNIILVIKLQ